MAKASCAVYEVDFIILHITAKLTDDTIWATRPGLHMVAAVIEL